MAWSPWTALRFAAGGAAALAAAYLVSEAVDPVSPALRARVALFRERAPAVEAVAVGNSHGEAVDFGALGVRGMHFSSAGQDAFEAGYLARYASDAPRLRYVLFAASYGVQRKDHSIAGGTDMRARRRQLYARTPLQGPMPGELALWVTGMLAPVVRDDHWRGVAARLVRPRPGIRLDEDGRARVPAAPPPGRDSLVRYAASVGALHRQLGEETMRLAPETPARVERMLDALAGELGARGVALVVYTPPYHESYLRTHDPAIVAETHALMGRLAAKHGNVVWLDYSADPRFSGRDDLFRNSDHVNPAGRRAFSRLLRACLEADARGCPAAAGPVPSARPHAEAGVAAAHPQTAAEDPQ